MTNTLLGAIIGDSLAVPFETRTSDDEFLLNWDEQSYIGSEYHGLKPGQYSDDRSIFN